MICLTANSRFAWLRNISFCKLLSLRKLPSCLARKILCLRFRTAFIIRRQLIWLQFSSCFLCPFTNIRVFVSNLSLDLISFSICLSYKTQVNSAIPFGQRQILNPYLEHYLQHSLSHPSCTLQGVPSLLPLTYWSYRHSPDLVGLVGHSVVTLFLGCYLSCGGFVIHRFRQSQST